LVERIVSLVLSAKVEVAMKAKQTETNIFEYRMIESP